MVPSLGEKNEATTLMVGTVEKRRNEHLIEFQRNSQRVGPRT
jgi:hypothetical protein